MLMIQYLVVPASVQDGAHVHTWASHNDLHLNSIARLVTRNDISVAPKEAAAITVAVSGVFELIACQQLSASSEMSMTEKLASSQVAFNEPLW